MTRVPLCPTNRTGPSPLSILSSFVLPRRPRSPHATVDRDRRGESLQSNVALPLRRVGRSRPIASSGRCSPGARRKTRDTWSSRRRRDGARVTRYLTRRPHSSTPITVPGPSGLINSVLHHHGVFDGIFCIHTHVVKFLARLIE